MNMSAMFTWAKCLHFGSSETEIITIKRKLRLTHSISHPFLSHVWIHSNRVHKGCHQGRRQDSNQWREGCRCPATGCGCFWFCPGDEGWFCQPWSPAYSGRSQWFWSDEAGVNGCGLGGVLWPFCSGWCNQCGDCSPYLGCGPWGWGRAHGGWQEVRRWLADCWPSAPHWDWDGGGLLQDQEKKDREQYVFLTQEDANMETVKDTLSELTEHIHRLSVGDFQAHVAGPQTDGPKRVEVEPAGDGFFRLTCFPEPFPRFSLRLLPTWWTLRTRSSPAVRRLPWQTLDPCWGGEGTWVLHHCQARQGAWQAVGQEVLEAIGQEGHRLWWDEGGLCRWRNGDDVPHLPDTQGSREEEVSLLQVHGGCGPLHSADGEHDGGWQTLGASLRGRWHLPLGGWGCDPGREGCSHGGHLRSGPIALTQHGPQRGFFCWPSSSITPHQVERPSCDKRTRSCPGGSPGQAQWATTHQAGGRSEWGPEGFPPWGGQGDEVEAGHTLWSHRTSKGWPGKGRGSHTDDRSPWGDADRGSECGRQRGFGSQGAQTVGHGALQRVLEEELLGRPRGQYPAGSNQHRKSQGTELGNAGSWAEDGSRPPRDPRATVLLDGSSQIGIRAECLRSWVWDGWCDGHWPWGGDHWVQGDEGLPAVQQHQAICPQIVLRASWDTSEGTGSWWDDGWTNPPGLQACTPHTDVQSSLWRTSPVWWRLEVGLWTLQSTQVGQAAETGGADSPRDPDSPSWLEELELHPLPLHRGGREEASGSWAASSPREDPWWFLGPLWWGALLAEADPDLDSACFVPRLWQQLDHERAVWHLVWDALDDPTFPQGPGRNGQGTPGQFAEDQGWGAAVPGCQQPWKTPVPGRVASMLQQVFGHAGFLDQHATGGDGDSGGPNHGWPWTHDHEGHLWWTDQSASGCLQGAPRDLRPDCGHPSGRPAHGCEGGLAMQYHAVLHAEVDAAAAGPLYAKLGYSAAAIEAMDLNPFGGHVNLTAQGAKLLGEEPAHSGHPNPGPRQSGHSPAPFITIEGDDGKDYDAERKPPITVNNVVSACGKDYMRKSYPGGKRYAFWGRMECGLVLSSVSPWEMVQKEKGVTRGGYCCKWCKGFWKGKMGSSRFLQITSGNVVLQMVDEPPERLYNRWVKDRIEFYKRLEPTAPLRDVPLKVDPNPVHRLRFSISNGLGNVSDAIWNIVLANPEKAGLEGIHHVADKHIGYWVHQGWPPLFCSFCFCIEAHASSGLHVDSFATRGTTTWAHSHQSVGTHRLDQQASSGDRPQTDDR